MTHVNHQGFEVSDARDLFQRPDGKWAIGQTDAPPAANWDVIFYANYQSLRNTVMYEASRLLDGSETGSGAFQSVINALGHTDSMAGQIRNGDTSKSAQLLSIMSNIIRALKPEVQPSLLDQLETLLRGIPKNLQDAVAFAAEQGSQALQNVASTSSGKLVAGLVILGGGLLALSYASTIARVVGSWKRRR